MKRRKSIWIVTMSTLLPAILFTSGRISTAAAQAPSTGVVMLPPSSIRNDAESGLLNTNLQIKDEFSAGSEGFQPNPAIVGPPVRGLFYQTPASLACNYDLVAKLPGCNPNLVTLNPSGGGKAIAIVDAYDYVNAFADLQNFSTQFGLAAISSTSFQVVYAPKGGNTPGSCVGSATKPPSGAGNGWDLEAALDTQYAHAMAPAATLYLVEAQSNSILDLFCAVTTASQLVQVWAGGGQVSMSWGGGEFSSETSFDSVFTTPKVVYFASSGDSSGVSYPSASPNVVSVGGTSLSTDPSTGNFISENIWQATGGGLSRYEATPSYQSGIGLITNSGKRGTPDVAADANPSTGVWVFNSTLVGAPAWFVVGGTSVASPVWAGIVNAAGSIYGSSNAELFELYNYDDATHAVINGSCGPYDQYVTNGRYNFCTGLGSPRGYSGK